MSACLIAAAFSGVQSSSCPKSNPALIILFFCLFLLVASFLFATAHLLRDENNFEEEEDEVALDENEVDATVVGKSNVRSIYYIIYLFSTLCDDGRRRLTRAFKNRVEYTLSRAFVRSRLVFNLREVELFYMIYRAKIFYARSV